MALSTSRSASAATATTERQRSFFFFRRATDGELAEREALVEFNRQREKTPGQIVNEFEEMLAVEEERAKERTKEAGSVGGNAGSEWSGNVSKPLENDGSAREKAAEKVNAGVSGGRWRG